MGHYHSSKKSSKGSSPLVKNSRRFVVKEFLKSNKIIQWIILGLFLVMQIVYSFALLWQSSYMFAIIQRNNTSFIGDSLLEEVESFEVDTDGMVSFVLMNGEEYNKVDTDFVFIDNNSRNETYYSKEDNVLITEIADNFAWEFLKGSKYHIVSIMSVLCVICFFVVRKRDWAVFSKKYTRVLSIFGTTIVLLIGVFTYLIF